MSHLTLAQVYAALADYHSNRDESHAELAAAEAEYWELAKSLETMQNQVEFISNWIGDR